jgi:type IV fimbrial biogenesis protein FimT
MARQPALPRSVRGVTLIELMIAVVIFSTLLGLAAPSITVWMQNSQIRSAAEILQHGLQVAQTTAVRRNTVTWFRLMNNLTNSCTVSLTGASWIVSLDNPEGACASAPSETVAPRIVQSRAGADNTRNATITADGASIGFDGMGRRIMAATASTINIDVANPSGGACNAVGGDMRCLRVSISVGGQTRMCDPSLFHGDTRSC